MKHWSDCKRLLIIRADNMGDVLMSFPAIAAVKQTFNAHLTLLTSSKGAEVAKLSQYIDDVIIADLPWVKLTHHNGQETGIQLVELLKSKKFDGCIIFTVYSQNPLPAAMLAWFANIPLRLAYCRENPYELLSHWQPDPEPLCTIKHQVERDLALVAAIGAQTKDKQIHLTISSKAFKAAEYQLQAIGVNMHSKYVVLHPGVSESKRFFPKSRWIAFAHQAKEKFGLPLVFTGNDAEVSFLKELAQEIGGEVHVVAGLFNVEEFAAVIAEAAVVVSVNTGTVHLAAAVQTPIVVLYAQTNPQHHPWMVPHVVLEYSIEENQKSKNQIINYVDRKIYAKHRPLPDSNEILTAVTQLLKAKQPH